MFSDESFEGVSIESSWKSTVYVRESETQTFETIGTDASTCPVDKLDAGVQTENDTNVPSVEVHSDNSGALTVFLKSTFPFVSKQLIENIHSHAFDGYNTNWADDDSETITRLLDLQHSPTDTEFQVTSLAWNFSGSGIAVAFGRLDHQQLCNHQSRLCLWNIDRHQRKSERADKCIDVFGCLTAVSFHPKLPSVVAGANFNGDVFVWDFARDDDNLLCSSAILDDGHQEPVSKVLWMRTASASRKQEKIISCGGDGRILLWQFNALSNKMKLISGFVLLTESIPRTLRPGKIRTDSELGVTCLCFSSVDDKVFVAGTENGTLFKCSLDSKAIAAKDCGLSVQLRSPVVFAFQSPHVGPVSGLSFAPFHRNAFLSCGTDGAVKLYSVLQVQPLLSFDLGHRQEALAVQWSNSRPLVFYVSTSSGELLVFDLKVNRVGCVQSVLVGLTKEAIHAMETNAVRSNLIATGGSQGSVKVWSLPSLLTEQQGGQDEETLLDGLTSAAQD